MDRPGTPLAAVRLDVAVGSADERPGEHGLAHVVEHLVMRCLMGGGRVGHGCLVDARTGRERTGYAVLVRRSDAAAVMDTLTTAFGELRVEPRVLTAELAAIRREVAQRTADIRWRLQEAVLAALWADTAYAHSTLGDPGTLDALTPDDVGRFHAAWYRPESATAVVVADRAHEVAATSTTAGRPHPRTGDEGAPAPAPAWSVRRHGGPAEHGVCLELPMHSGQSGRAVGLGFVDPVPASHSRTHEELARRAVRAVGAVHLQRLRLRRHVCVWAMVSAPHTDHALRVVRAALGATRARLLSPEGDLLLRTEALIPELRAHDDLETAAARAGEGDTGPSAPPDAAEIAAVIAGWERRVGAIRPEERVS